MTGSQYLPRLPTRWERFRRRWLSHTIWAEGTLSDVPPRFRVYARVVFPAIYLLNVIVYGVVGVQTGGSNVLKEALPSPGANILCGLIGATALIGLLGIVFGGGPRTPVGQQVERLGALLLVLPTLAYFILLTAALGGGANAPLAAFVGTTLVILFGLIRAFDLSSEIGRRASQHRTGR